MKKLQTQHLTRAAAVGAAYTVLSLFQLRVQPDLRSRAMPLF